jgi:hypothetical protein
MKILYVILTCDKNKDRQRWQRETWLKEIPHIYLDKPIGEEIYNNAPLKYIDFFICQPDLLIEPYDFFFFCDDDTFVYTDKLESFLAGENSKAFMIGFSGGTFPIYNLNIQWCSGGAGIALSRECVKNIQTHLRSTPKPLVTHETDISLAIWAMMANEKLIVIDNKKFSPFNPLDAAREGMQDCITYHYCNEENFHELYNKRQTV